MGRPAKALFTASDDSYESARAHAEALDQQLGFRVEEIELRLLQEARQKSPEGNHKTWGALLHNGNQTWVGLSHQTLQTPYHELTQICLELDPAPGTKVIDLGAGYGRLGVVLSVFYPEVFFQGYEYVPERVTEGQRVFKLLGCERASLYEQDLTQADFHLPEGEYYFIYDYGTLEHIRQTMRQLETIAHSKKFRLIARGKGTRSLIQYEHPWLSQVFPAVHREHYSIYSMSSDL